MLYVEINKNSILLQNILILFMSSIFIVKYTYAQNIVVYTRSATKI